MPDTYTFGNDDANYRISNQYALGEKAITEYKQRYPSSQQVSTQTGIIDIHIKETALESLFPTQKTAWASTASPEGFDSQPPSLSPFFLGPPEQQTADIQKLQSFSPLPTSLISMFEDLRTTNTLAGTVEANMKAFLKG